MNTAVNTTVSEKFGRPSMVPSASRKPSTTDVNSTSQLPQGVLHADVHAETILRNLV